ncbi:MAG TPA: FHA domain-containing protein [Pyrinomonadaceae bacterium]|nr:FHA domain-containing protein [Pyrinomonadaceae bacterium]
MALNLRTTTFIIVREDRAEDAKTLVTEGLRIGRLPECDIVINHPTVSRLHAGINEIGGRFYILNLSGSNATTINGRVIPFDEAEALASGDTVQIGPFFLFIEQTTEGLLKLRVSLQVALNVGEFEARQKQMVADERERVEQERASASSEVAGALKVFWDKRTREKAGRQSPLHPHDPPRLGKARFNWTPTRDLVRPWPWAIFVWAIIIVGALSALAAFKFKNAFAPEVISTPHTRTAFLLNPPIAKEPNGNSCMNCHVVGVGPNRVPMEAKCAACHQTESFIATTTRAHRDAGITCIVCHTEHKGADFKPMNAALDSCTICHNDNNKKTHNGKRVHTPHGGTLGYPVVGGEWVWKGLDAEELALKPEVAKLRRPSDTEQQWRNKQFHALHIYRVRAVATIEGIKDEDAGGGMRVISCSSCHRSFAPIDRETPRTTCIRCHNGAIFEKDARAVRSTNAISCTSCHVQHIRDTHWRPSLFVEQPLPPDWHEIVTAK